MVTRWRAAACRGRWGPALASALAAAGLAVATAGAAQTDGARGQDGRVFRHEAHRSVTCGVCHAREERHRVVRSWTPRDCAACHHDDATPAGCTSCHEPASFAAPRQTATPMALSVWEAPRVRDLVFDHGRHAEVGCLDCHRGGMSPSPEACASCHVYHHRPEAECARCHVAPEPAVHGLAAHGSCGGAGCHSDAATQRPMLSRSSCLVCHDGQREHRPGRTCVRCHIKPAGEGREHGDL
jgi:hypothetical protein